MRDVPTRENAFKRVPASDPAALPFPQDPERGVPPDAVPAARSSITRLGFGQPDRLPRRPVCWHSGLSQICYVQPDPRPGQIPLVHA
jgi:hypothetical protein